MNHRDHKSPFKRKTSEAEIATAISYLRVNDDPTMNANRLAKLAGVCNKYAAEAMRRLGRVTIHAKDTLDKLRRLKEKSTWRRSRIR